MKLTGLVGVPCREQGRWASFGNCLDDLILPPYVDIRRATNNSVAWARNMIAHEMLDRGAEWVFFLDDDQMFKPNVLMNILKHPEDIVIGHTLMRCFLNGESFFRPIWSNTELFLPPFPQRPRWDPVVEITLEANKMMRLTSGTGGGVLVRRRVFETMPFPWWTIGQIYPDMFWEDIWFCQEARKAGFEIWGDPDVMFGHVIPTTVWPYKDEDGNWATVLANGFQPFLLQPWTTVKVPKVMP